MTNCLKKNTEKICIIIFICIFTAHKVTLTVSANFGKRYHLQTFYQLLSYGNFVRRCLGFHSRSFIQCSVSHIAEKQTLSLNKQANAPKVFSYDSSPRRGLNIFGDGYPLTFSPFFCLSIYISF